MGAQHQPKIWDLLFPALTKAETHTQFKVGQRRKEKRRREYTHRCFLHSSFSLSTLSFGCVEEREDVFSAPL
jgi:hypothetical protein